MSIERAYLPFIASYYLGFLNSLDPDSDLARHYFEKTIELVVEHMSEDPSNQYAESYKALALAMLGNRKAAIEIVRRLESAPEVDGDLALNIARCYALLNETAFSEKFKALAKSLRAGPTEKEIQLDPHFSHRVTP